MDRRWRSAAGITVAGAVVLLVTPWLPWFELPGGGFDIIGGGDGGRVHSHVSGIVGGPGQIVFVSGIALAVLAAVLVLWPRARPRGWISVVPGLVAAGAVGHWHRGVFPISAPFGVGWSLVPLVAPAILAAAAGLWPTSATRRARLSLVLGSLALAILVCGIAAVVGTEGSEIPLVFAHVFPGSDAGYFTFR